MVPSMSLSSTVPGPEPRARAPCMHTSAHSSPRLSLSLFKKNTKKFPHDCVQGSNLSPAFSLLAHRRSIQNPARDTRSGAKRRAAPAAPRSHTNIHRDEQNKAHAKPLWYHECFICRQGRRAAAAMYKKVPAPQPHPKSRV
jgi:hypothetical protein